MTTDDHGNFDVAIEMAKETLASAARNRGMPSSPTSQINRPWMQGQIVPQVRVNDIDLIMSNTFRLLLSLEGTKIEITEIAFQGEIKKVEDWMKCVNLGRTTVTIDDLLEMRGNALIVDFGIYVTNQ
jgi:hypothetical protein